MPAGKQRHHVPELLCVILHLLVVCWWHPVTSASAVTAASTSVLSYLDSPAAAAQLAPQLAAALARQEQELPPPATRPGQTAYVSQQPQQGSTASLVSALQDPQVTHIVLISSYDVGGELDGLVVSINRNLTITGQHGIEDVLDLRYKRAVLHLCSTCTLAFVNITLEAERRGNGSPIDLVVGKPGSKVLVRTIARLRDACTSAADTVRVVVATPRSKQFPGDGPRDQLASTADVTFKGRKYPATLVVVDYAVDQPLVVQEGRAPSGGVAQYAVGMLRLCRHEVQPDCLKDKGPDACVNMLIDAVMEEEGGGGSGAARNKGIIATAVLVPTLVLALLAAAGAVWFRSRRRQQWSHKEHMTPLKDVESAWSTSMRSQPNNEVLGSSLVERKGWQLVNTVTAPSAQEDAAADTHIQLEELLGQGSFGRVYRAQWSGREVAVKVIPHTKSTLQDVDNEMSLMLSLQHPNLVRAFQCMTFTHAGSISTARTSGHPRSISGGAECSLDVRLATKSASPAQATNRSSKHLPVGTEQQPQQQQQQQGQREQVSALPCGLAAESREAAGDTQSTSDSSCPPWMGQLDPVETWLIMEFCNMGTLWSIFTNAEVQQQWSCDTIALSRLLLLLDAARGLQALHAHNICHGDLNARNVLVSSDNMSDCGMVAKLADLGLSRVMKQHATHRTTETVGTMSHCSPELLNNGRMSPASDVYAFGIMMWELYVGQAAFRRMHYAGFYEAIVLRKVRPAVPPDMPPDYAALMQWCWAADPKSRPGTDMLVEVLAFMVQQHQQQQADPTQLLQLHPQLEGRAAPPAAAAAASSVKVQAGSAATAASGTLLGCNQEPGLKGQGTCTDSAGSSDAQHQIKHGDDHTAV